MAVIDFTAAAQEAFRELLPEFKRELLPEFERAVRRVLDERSETPMPLADILGLSNDGARKREQRDLGLRALACATRGRRRLYQRATVLGYLSTTARGSR